MNILLTGGSTGIGKDILKCLLEDKHTCTVLNRSNTLDITHQGLELWVNDLSDLTTVEKVCAEIKEKDFDVLINNAGAGSPCLYDDISIDAVQYELNLNLIAPMFLIKAVLPGMKKKKWGRIINMSSITGKTGTPFLYSYSASKAGLNSITQSIAKTVEPEYNITINAICPGGVETDSSIKGRGEISQLLDMDEEAYQNNMVKNMRLGRMIKPAEIASFVRFLIQEETSCITGQCFNLCGALLVH